jgi:hypothetical protein
MDAPIFAPYIQLGFAGFACLLTGIIVWLVRRLIDVINQNNAVISGNTEAIRRLRDVNDDQKALMEEIRDQLFQRPCLLQDQHLAGGTHEDRTS